LFTLGSSLVYSSTISVQSDFFTLATLRAAQTAGLAFLFVPISTIAFSTLPTSMNRDATSLFTMFRNIGGSIGIALATTLVTRHGQMHQSDFAAHLTPFSQPYLDEVARNIEVLRAQGVAATRLTDGANAVILSALQRQAAIRAYLDVFLISAVMAFGLVPFAFLFAPTKAVGRRPAGAE
jgi:DHA2 family multidrug resistance protein